MEWIVAFVLLAVPCFSQEARKPPCNAQNRGRFWPDRANTDSAFARQAVRSGDLLMCSRGAWKYSWQPLTVRFSQLGHKRNAAIPDAGQKDRKATGAAASTGTTVQAEAQPLEAEAEPHVRRP